MKIAESFSKLGKEKNNVKPLRKGDSCITRKELANFAAGGSRFYRNVGVAGPYYFTFIRKMSIWGLGVSQTKTAILAAIGKARRTATDFELH